MEQVVNAESLEQSERSDRKRPLVFLDTNVRPPDLGEVKLIRV